MSAVPGRIVLLVCALLHGTSLAAQVAASPAPVSPAIVLGAPELVFDFKAGADCPQQRPDKEAQAYRRDDGKVVFLVSDAENYAFVGDTLEAVDFASDCRRVLSPPPASSDPADFKGKMWLMNAVATPQGTLMGVIHNEYHGEAYTADCKAAAAQDRGAQPCWYASTLLVLSQDGGKTFDPGSIRPLAIFPYQYKPLQGRMAYAGPQILSHRDGDATPYMYVFFRIADNKTSNPALTASGQHKGTCVMRGTSADPASWRMWGGTDFDVTVANPYVAGGADPQAHLCDPVLPFNSGPIRYVPSRKEYIALGGDQGAWVYAVSRDLVQWSAPVVLKTGIIGINDHTLKTGTTIVPTLYPALLDPSSPSPSFETIEGRPYLYYVAFPAMLTGQSANSDRQLMRIPLKITF